MSQLIIPPWERWLPVVGYEGYYEVSDYGRVRSIDRVVPDGHGGTKQLTGCILVQTPCNDGRLTVKLSMYGVTSTKLVHQLVLKAYAGPRPVGLLGCHENGDHTKNWATNLRWGSPSENMLDKQRHGTDHARNKTCCPLEHALKLPNLVASRWRDGHRICLACARARANEQRARSRGDEFNFKLVADRHYAKIMGA